MIARKKEKLKILSRGKERLITEEGVLLPAVTERRGLLGRTLAGVLGACHRRRLGFSWLERGGRRSKDCYCRWKLTDVRCADGYLLTKFRRCIGNGNAAQLFTPELIGGKLG